MSFVTRLSWRPSARGAAAVVLAGLIVLGIAAASVWPGRVIGVAEEFMHVVRGLGVRGAVVFAMVQLLVAVSGILPASLLGVAAGVIYGLVPGFLLAAASTWTGALLSFFLSDSCFEPRRRHSGRPRLRDLDAQLRRTAGNSCACCDFPRSCRSLPRVSCSAYQRSACATTP